MATHQVLTPAATGIRTGFKAFALRLCVAITLLVVLLSMGEAGAALYLWLNPPVSPYADLRVPREYARELETTRRQQYVPYVEWRRLPHSGRFIHVNKDGLRQTLMSSCDDPRNPVIWMFGDSALWGTGATDGETLPSRMAELYQRSGQSVCVVNYGEAGWVSTQEVIQLMIQLKRATRRPDIVVLYDGPDEVQPTLPGAPADRHIAYQRFHELLERSARRSEAGWWFIEDTNTARALTRIAESLSGRLFSLERPAPKSELSAGEEAAQAESVVENYEQNLKLVDALSGSYHFQPFYFWYPTRLVGHKPLTLEEELSPQRRESENTAVIRAAYGQLGRLQRPNFFYMGDLFDTHPEWLYLDDSHLTPEGNRIAARYVFKALHGPKAAGAQ